MVGYGGAEKEHRWGITDLMGVSPVSWDVESQGSHGVSSVIKRHRARMLGAMRVKEVKG